MINEYLAKFIYDNYALPGETVVKYRFDRELHRHSQTYRYFLRLIIEDSNGILRDVDVLLGTSCRNLGTSN